MKKRKTGFKCCFFVCNLYRCTEWAQVMDAALDTVSLAMEHHMDAFCQFAQKPANVIAAKAECDPQYIINFGEAGLYQSKGLGSSLNPKP
jgi:hypothetical protein